MIKEQYNLNELLISISNTMDLANPVLMKHQQRTAYIAWCMAQRSKLSYSQRENLFLAAILHDIGALTTNEKVSLHEMETVDAKRHCELGYHLYKSISWLSSAANIVRYHHTLACDIDSKLSDIRVQTQILHLSDLLERLIDKDTYILHQKLDLIDKIKGLSTKAFDEEVVNLLVEVAQSDKFWLDITSPRLTDILSKRFTKKSILLDLNEMKSVSLVFRSIIDFRSPFTASHSTGVAACASQLARYFGFSKKEIDLMEVAGYLHDIGKLAVSNDLLEKNGRLSTEEFDVMKKHAYESYQILSQISGFETITEWAVLHHEKLDGHGYPFALDGGDISLGSRIFAVSDIFTALTEDRPYRKAMTKEQTMNVLKYSVKKNHLDPIVVNTLLDNYDEIYEYLKDEKEKAINSYNSFMNLY